MFAANAGKKAGEFYTPHEVSLLMSEIIAFHLKHKTEISILDPTSGSGSLLINIGKSVGKHIANENNIKYFAQELKENTYNLTRMNLVMRGILADNIHTRNADTLADDWPYFDESDPTNTYNPLYVDAVVSNPPYSQQWDSSNKEAEPRYARFGLAPKTKADYAFLLHDLYHIKPDGIMTIVLPHGVLFRGGEEGAIRKNLIEFNHIDAIIGLPANIFFGTGIPTIILVLKQKRPNTDVLIVDASKGFEKVGKNNKLRASDIKRIVDNVINREDTPKFAKLVSRDTLRENDYNLNIPRYVDSSADAESWDIYASMFGGIPHTEIDELHKYWKAFPALRTDLFERISDHCAALKVEQVKKSIRQHADVIGFTNNFATAFEGFHQLLKDRLLTNMMTVSISNEEEMLSSEIFTRLETIPLIDIYNAFQLLDNEWTDISGDLEIIQTEGFDAARLVEPNMVIKKKDGKDIEKQEGWKGHVIPFDLVQNSLLKSELDALKEKQNRQAEITAEQAEILDSLSEEEKEGDITNEAKDSFVGVEIAKIAKQIINDRRTNAARTDAACRDAACHVSTGDAAYESNILIVADLLIEDKSLKTQIKIDTEKLHLLTKVTIENLTDAQVHELLELKWITPLVSSLHQLPEQIVNELAANLQALADKYSTTYKEVVEQIHSTEKSLTALIDDLTANDFDSRGLAEFQTLLKGE